MKGTLKIKDEITGMVIGVIENYEARITPDEWLTGYLINGDVRHWLQNNGFISPDLKVRFLFVAHGEQEPEKW